MGNVNGREDGSRSPSDSGVVIEEEEDDDEFVSSDAAAPPLMAHSPPHTPISVQSPLKFAPQVLFHRFILCIWLSNWFVGVQIYFF